MITGSPPTWLTWVPREYSETAIRAVTFSRRGRRIAADAESARERSLEEWYVATTGHSAAHRASSDRLGVAGSCRCSTSKAPSCSQRRVRAAAIGPKDIRATDPL